MRRPCNRVGGSKTDTFVEAVGLERTVAVAELDEIPFFRIAATEDGQFGRRGNERERVVGVARSPFAERFAGTGAAPLVH